jgi:hypothetical protein
MRRDQIRSVLHALKNFRAKCELLLIEAVQES